MAIFELALVCIFVTYLSIDMLPAIIKFKDKWWHSVLLGADCIPCWSVRTSVIISAGVIYVNSNLIYDCIFATIATFIYFKTIEITQQHE